MTEDEAREIVRRDLRQAIGPDGAFQAPSLADKIQQAADEWMDFTVARLYAECREAARTRSYPSPFDDLPDPPDWSEIVKRHGGRPRVNDARDGFILLAMDRLIRPPLSAVERASGARRGMKIRPAARIVAEVLAEVGIEINPRRVEKVYRRFSIKVP